MPVSRLRDIPGIGVDRMADAAVAADDHRFLRLENLDTDILPPAVAREATKAAVDDDAANSYLPFRGHRALREAAAAHVSRISGVAYDPTSQCVSCVGGLNRILNALLATVEPGREVVLFDPIYAGLVNRVRLAGGVPRFVRSMPGPSGWTTDPDDLAAAIGPDTAALLLMGPAMPTGAFVTREHLEAIAGPGAWSTSWPRQPSWGPAARRLPSLRRQPGPYRSGRPAWSSAASGCCWHSPSSGGGDRTS
jgi:aspartate/methionine/tyrosine aminotransferase